MMLVFWVIKNKKQERIYTMKNPVGYGNMMTGQKIYDYNVRGALR